MTVNEQRLSAKVKSLEQQVSAAPARFEQRAIRNQRALTVLRAWSGARPFTLEELDAEAELTREVQEILDSVWPLSLAGIVQTILLGRSFVWRDEVLTVVQRGKLFSFELAS